MTNKKVLGAALTLIVMVVIGTNLDAVTSLAMVLMAGGSNENLYLNPSGNGRVVMGGDSIVVASRSSDPSTNRPGQIYFNSSTNELRWFDGTNWRGFATKSNTYSIDLESGSTQYLSITDGSQTGLKMSSSFTMAMWVKFESLPSSGNSFALAGKMDASTGSDFGYLWFFNNNSGTYRFLTYLSPSSGNASPYTRNWTPSVGTWYHIAVVWDAGATKLRYYINGVQEGADITTSEGSLYTGGTAPFTVGMNGDGSSNGFDGLIDDVRIFNSALSSNEILIGHNKELTGAETGLKGYWKLNNAITDLSGNGNTLTNNGSAVFSTDTPF